MRSIDNYTINAQSSVRKAMKKLDQSHRNILFVTNEEQILFGALTDGDIRRHILSGKSLDDIVKSACNPNPISVGINFVKSDIKQMMLERRIQAIPVLDNEHHIVDVLFWNSVFEDGTEFQLEQKLAASVVIMAGGKGTRLEPFTQVLPKPLIPIHDKPVIEHIIEKFTSRGCNDFFMTVNYKGKILKAFFEELNPYYNITFIDEDIPLGTAGSLGLLPRTFHGPFFVTNCDTIINIDYQKAYQFHTKEKNDITLVASAKEYVIPYGTCVLNKDGHLSHINEKPKFDFLISTGMYILNPEVLDIIPKNKLYHITNLIEDAKEKGMKVGVFPIDDDAWIDIGQWAEYRKAVEKL